MRHVMFASALIISSHVNIAFCSIASPLRSSSTAHHVRVARIIRQFHRTPPLPHNSHVRHRRSQLIYRPCQKSLPFTLTQSCAQVDPIPAGTSSTTRSIASSLTPLSTSPSVESGTIVPEKTQRDSIDALREQYQNIPLDAAARRNALNQLVKQSFSFKLDDFQLEALNALSSESSVVLSAPTGAGKTVIGEMAVYLALCRQQRVFYTTPLKALSNQKFYDFKRLFGVDRVGLLTGDITINREADVLVMTTEIYRNMLYAEATERNIGRSPTEGLFAVVFDEFHYLNDRDRGTVWEESVVNSPSHVLLVALSATMSNSNDVRDWFSSVQGQTALVESNIRPVPLKFGYCDHSGLTPLFDDEGRGNSKPKGNGFGRRGRKKQKSNEKVELKMHPKLLRRIKTHKGTSGPSQPSRDYDDTPRQEKDIIREKYQKITDRNSRRDSFAEIPSFPYVVRCLRRREMLPCIVFIFSRAGCDRAASAAGMERECLVSPREEDMIRERLDIFVAENPDMVQQDRIDLALKGVASHHAGLLPLWKLCVEELFQDGLIKVVFATETLAAGINMPARTTVISSLSKRAGEEGFRPLTTSEVLQMAGRAGRRGKDILGHSLILKSRKEGALDAFKVLTKNVDALQSHFTPTYGMVLNLLLSRPLEEARRLVDRSFGNFLKQKIARMGDDGNQLGTSISETDMETLRVEKTALEHVLQEAKEIFGRVDANDMHLFVKCLERVKAEKRALSYLVQQSTELDSNLIEDTLTFAPTGTKLLLREKVKPSSGADRRQKRRGYKEALLAAGAGDLGAELRSFYLSGENGDVEDIQMEEEASEAVVEAILLDMHAEAVNVSPIFVAVDAHGQLRLFNDSAVSRILYEDEAVDVDSIASGWSDFSLPSKSQWRSIGHDQFVAPLPDGLDELVMAIQNWKANRVGEVEEGGSAKPVIDDKATPEMETQRSRVEEAKRMAREQKMYKRNDLGELLAAKRTISNIESTLDGSSDPLGGKRKRRRSRNAPGRYSKLSEGETKASEIVVENSSWDDFMSLVGVLQHYGFVDDSYSVTSVGEMGAKVRSENELWTSVVLLEHDLEHVSPVHLGPIIGATLMEGGGRGDTFVDWELSEEVREQILQLLPFRTRLLAVQNEFGAEVSIGLDGEMMGLIEMWASGVSWVELLRATSVQEGDVCRIIRRTLDVLRQIQHLPVVSGGLKKNARRTIALMDRFPITDDRTYWVADSERASSMEMEELESKP